MKKIDLIGKTKKIDCIPLLIILTMASPLFLGGILHKMYSPKINKNQVNSVDNKTKNISKNKTSLDKLEVDTKTHLDELKCLQEKVELGKDEKELLTHLEEKYKSTLKNLEELKFLDKQ
jgi:hypothetical protein